LQQGAARGANQSTRQFSAVVDLAHIQTATPAALNGWLARALLSGSDVRGTESLSRVFGEKFKAIEAISAHVIEAAIGLTTVGHIFRATTRTRHC
jgi:hypothetical protein